jgi:hypothetical protein
VGYVKNVWVNGDESKPLDQIRMNHIEDGIFLAAATADSATATAAAAATLDEVAASMDDTGSGVSQAAQGQFPVHRVWDGSAYPTRVSGALNVFFGPTDPGLAMEADDYWANPDATTIDEVEAAVGDTGSDLYAATRTATAGTTLDIPLGPRSLEPTVLMKDIGYPGAEIYGWEMDPDVTSRLIGVVTIPYGWNTARVRVYYYVPTGSGAGDVRVARAGAAFTPGVAPSPEATVTNTLTAPVAGVIDSILLTVDMALEGFTMLSVTIKRNGAEGGDTLAAPIYYLAARLEKTS